MGQKMIEKKTTITSFEKNSTVKLRNICLTYENEALRT